MSFSGGPYQQQGGGGGGNYAHPRGYSSDFSDDFGGDSEPWFSGSPEKSAQVNYSSNEKYPTTYSNNENNTRYSGRFDLQEDNYSSEPPLLEEIGIRFDHIWEKTQAVILLNKVGYTSFSVNSLEN